MSERVGRLLSELEELSARAVELTAEAHMTAAQELIEQRGILVAQVKTALDESSTAFSYTDWNRLVIIHHQGNRMYANLEAARGGIATALLDNVREHALLECMSGVVDQNPPAQLDERG